MLQDRCPQILGKMWFTQQGDVGLAMRYTIPGSRSMSTFYGKFSVNYGRFSTNKEQPGFWNLALSEEFYSGLSIGGQLDHVIPLAHAGASNFVRRTYKEERFTLIGGLILSLINS